jgi:hypothetical protein
MSDKHVALNVEVDLTKPATVLVEKIASALGVIYEPARIKSRAKAEAEAKVILAKAKTKVNSIEHRALQRLVLEESKKQANIESVINKAIPQVSDGATPERLEDDWIANFFEKSRNISDHEMQDVWAKLLASESVEPGSYSKRTVNLLAELDKSDAVLFTKLANFTIIIPGSGLFPYVNDITDEIYSANGLDFSGLQHLDSLGLINFNNITGYKTYRPKQKGGNFVLMYHDDVLIATVPEDRDSELSTGHAMYTQQGMELFKICSVHPIDGFKQYVINKLQKNGLSTQEINS